MQMLMHPIKQDEKNKITNMEMPMVNAKAGPVPELIGE